MNPTDNFLAEQVRQLEKCVNLLLKRVVAALADDAAFAEEKAIFGASPPFRTLSAVAELLVTLAELKANHMPATAPASLALSAQDEELIRTMLEHKRKMQAQRESRKGTLPH